MAAPPAMVFSLSAIALSLRTGTFLTKERVRLWAIAFLAGFVPAIAWLIVSAHGNVDYAGRPLGTDFSSFYAAGKLALGGHSPYDQRALHHMQQALFGTTTPYYAFAYPPIFLLLAGPLAALPYFAALIVWQGASLALYVFAMARLRRRLGAAIARDTIFFALVLGFTATFVNLTHGQNGFLAAGLLALALSLLDENAWAAGICFGLMAFKPQLGLLIPFALVAGGRWRSFAAAGATVACLVALSIAVFGVQSWPAFFAAAAFSQHAILDAGAVGYDKMVSVFAWMRLWRLPPSVAYGTQIVAALAVLAATIRLWSSAADMRTKSAGLCLGLLLVTPFALDYDLMLLAPALLLMAAQARRRGLAPYEAALLALLWAMPIAARPIAAATGLPLAVWAVATAFMFVAGTSERRA